MVGNERNVKKGRKRKRKRLTIVAWFIMGL
jgi:hypothetical protein